jgi:hypothetical protein
VAKPETLPDGSVNLMVWKCVVPGKEGVSKNPVPSPTPNFLLMVLLCLAISANTRRFFNFVVWHMVIKFYHLKSTEQIV